MDCVEQADAEKTFIPWQFVSHNMFFCAYCACFAARMLQMIRKTDTHPFSGLFSRAFLVSRHQKC